MRRGQQLSVVLLAGVLLAAAAVELAGIAAALPIPRVSEHVRREHGRIILVTVDLIGAVPLTVLAWMSGRLLSRTIGPQRRLWVAAALPWIAYGLVEPVDLIRSCGYELAQALAVISTPPCLDAWLMACCRYRRDCGWHRGYPRRERPPDPRRANGPV